MPTSTHELQIYVNGGLLELTEGNPSIRLNSTLFDPTRLNSTTAEYSFSFDLPMTASNNKLLNFANSIETTGKFNRQYKAEAIADGNTIFKGTLKITSIEQNVYKCNLISIKQNKVEDIFGESKMTEFEWKVPYNGMTTIKEVNSDLGTDYFFPLVCYGAFQKNPYRTYTNEYKAYTSKYQIDDTNLWYHQSFSPSLRLTELVRRLFEKKGYNVSGNIFDDPIAQSVYLSTNLKDGYDPLYNLGNDSGKLDVSFKFRNFMTDEKKTRKTSSFNLQYQMNYAHEHTMFDKYNWTQSRIYDIWQNADYWQHKDKDPRDFDEMYNQKVEYTNKELFRNNSIVIPATGAYKITLEASISIEDAIAYGPVIEYNQREQHETAVYHNFTSMPVEIQLVKNTDECELIYGFDGKDYTVFPHEPPANNLTMADGNIMANSSVGSTKQIETIYNKGYIPNQGDILAYDPIASENFICGFTTVGRHPSAIKRGYSWSSGTTAETHSRYNLKGYQGVNYQNNTFKLTPTDYNANQYNSAPENYMNVTGGWSMKGRVSLCVWLEKNDVLSLKCINKLYQLKSDDITDVNEYQTDIEGTLHIEAYSPKVADIESDSLTYSLPSVFDTELNLANFNNADTKMSEFVDNFIKAFNLNMEVDNQTVILNKNKVEDTLSPPIDLDDRVNQSEISVLPIGYPQYIQVNYKIDDTEAGYYNSVPKQYINDADWKDHAFIGSEKITLDENGENTATASLTNSYTWYANFKVVLGETTKTISLPLIIKDEWMIENYKDEESMKEDGKGLPQRWWFRQLPDADIELTTTFGEVINPSIPTNIMDGFNLDYMNERNGLLYRYFNVEADNSLDAVEFECYLSAMEYNRIKNGNSIKINSDVYRVMSVTGYDPSGRNKTKIKAIRYRK